MEDKKMITKYNSNRCYVPAYSDDFFNDFVSRKYYGHRNNPAVNIVEESNAFRIDVAAAGLAKEDISIKLEEDVLTISSDQKESKSEKKDQYARREFDYAYFRRSFQMPESVEQESIRAEHQNGVLTVHIPKKEEAEKPGPRSIEIQ